MIINLVILLTFCVNKIYSDESEEGKYIDLLPEDEKREFLEKVARRILEEVESKDTVKTSVELTDGQLNKHSAYVSKVMKEEEDSIMKKHNNDTNSEKKNIRSDEPVLKNADKNENDEVQIDLTLRQGKSSIKRHNPERRSISDTVDIPNKTMLEESTKVALTTEDTVLQQKITDTEATTVESKKKDDNISIEITIEGTENKKTPEDASKRSTPVTNINIPVQVVYDSSQNIRTDGPKITLKEDITDTPTTTEESQTEGNEYIYQSREENGHNDETRKTVTVMENYDPKKCWSSEESRTTTVSHGNTTNGKVTGSAQKVVTDCNGKPIKIENTSKWIIVDPPDVTGGIYEPIDMTRSKNTTDTNEEHDKIANGIITTTDTTTVNSDTVETTLPLIDKVNSTQIDVPINNTNAVEEVNKEITTIRVEEITDRVNNSVATSEQISTTSTTPIEPITTTTSASVAVKPEMFEQLNTNKLTTHDNNENTKKAKIIISTTQNRFEDLQLKTFGLRIGEVETQMENSKNNLVELETKYNENKIKELKVYEIPPGKSPFVTDKPIDMTKDVPKITDPEFATSGPSENFGQPNYVPIYNYSPNNAYFNAYNRLGPNYEDEEINRNGALINSNVLRIKADSSISFESRDRTEKKYYYYNSRPFIKKIRSKILLPPSMPRNKKKKYNPEIYLDDFVDTEENSFFKKKKKRIKYVRSKNWKLRNKKKNNSKKKKLTYVDDDSLQIDDKFKEGILKNHIEAVRHYLSSKNHFGFYESPYEKMNKLKNREKKKKHKQDKMQTIKEEKLDENVDDKNLDEIIEKGKEVVEPKVDEYIKPKEDENIHKGVEDSKPPEDEDNKPGEDDSNRPGEDVDNKPTEDEVNKPGENENNPAEEIQGKMKKVKRKRKWQLRAKSKKNKHPKTGPVDGFNNKRPKHSHGIDLDYYFGRIGLDSSDFNSDDSSTYSEARDSSSREGNLNVGSLSRIYYSNSRENYDYYRRTVKGAKKDAKKGRTSDKKENKKSKLTMEDLILVKNISEVTDLVKNVLTMQEIIRINKRSVGNNLKTHMTVLSDMIQMDNRALSQYDWLGSAVDIQAALRKLIDLTEQLNDGDFDIHPADWELFKYVFYIYETADIGMKNNMKILRKMLHPPIPFLKQKPPTQNNQNNTLTPNQKQDRQTLSKLMPKPKKMTGSTKVTKYQPYFSLRTQLKVYQQKLKEKEMLLTKVLEFQEFLYSARDNLNDLHDAIKHIGLVSKWKTVKWYRNLKDVYLNQPKKRELLTVLLHLSLNRVINLLEESAKEGVERSFLSFVKRKKNALKIRRTKEEMLFVLTILRELEADALDN